MRLYAGLAEVLDRDAIVIGDGGDFVSYAGRVIETYEPGCWMDPGPFGCLGAGPGPGDRRGLREAGPADLPAARRRRLRLQRHGVRHAGPARAAGRRGDRQQRDLGAREAPDGVPLRLLAGGRAARRRRPTRRSPRRSAATASWSASPAELRAGAGACLRLRRARPSSTSSPTPRSSTRARPSSPEPPAPFAGVLLRLRSSAHGSAPRSPQLHPRRLRRLLRRALRDAAGRRAGAPRADARGGRLAVRRRRPLRRYRGCSSPARAGSATAPSG